MAINDGSKRVFINLHGQNREDFSDEFLEMMEYIEHTTDAVAQKVHSKRIKLIHNKVNNIKLSEKTGVKYMQHWEELAEAKDEGIAEGRAEGRMEERYEIVTDMLRDGMNINTVARIAKMTSEQVMAIGKKAAVL